MTGGLPRGLISIEDNPTHETERQDDDSDDGRPQLDLTSVGKTWRIYSASRNAIEADTGYRLENLFWRTWGNKQLLKELHPVTFTSIVRYIGSGRGRVLLHRPSQLAIASPTHDEDDSTPVPSGPPTATASPRLSKDDSAGTSDHPSHIRQVSNGSAKSPQSILKKPSVDHSYVEQSTDQALTFASEEVQRSSGSSNSTTDTTPSDRPRMKRQPSAGNKKTAFVANDSRTKARPPVPRRKSSQGTIPQTRSREPLRSPIKSPLKSPLRATSGNEPFPQHPILAPSRHQPLGPPPGLPLPTSDVSGAGFLLPSASSWQSVESTSPGKGAHEPVIQNSIPLVDPDFRKQFVENRSASQINLALGSAASKMRKTGSVVRFADDLPDLGKRTSRESNLGPGRRGSGTEGRRSSLSSHSPAIEDEDDDSEDEGLSMLPRSRSQLSLAIETQRRISGTQNLGGNTSPGDAGATSKAKGKGKLKFADENDKEDTEDELLKMGRKDGVTKAGGPRLRQALKSSPPLHDLRSRSPTPPPIF